MDGPRFNEIARLLAAGVNRRQLFGGLAAALLGRPAATQPVLAACHQVRRKCGSIADCCAGARCQGCRCAC